MYRNGKGNPGFLQRELFALTLLAGCVTVPAPYGPKTADGSTGYTDEQLGQNRFRVTYTGNSSTPRDTVEDYLLYRAAEVTLSSGFAAFVFDARDTKAKTTYFSTFHDFDGWPYRGFGWYWHSWPGDDFGDVESRPITRYEAYAEIVMLTADQAKAETRALNAHDVQARLGPKVLPPPSPAK